MSLQTKPPGETTHFVTIPSCVRVPQNPLTQRTDRTLCSALTLDPSRLCCQPTGCQHWPSLSRTLRHRTGEWAGWCVSSCLTHTQTHTLICTAPTSLSHLVYTPRLESCFKALKCRVVHWNLSLWGQLCPSELLCASENRHHQPHSLGCNF